MYPGGQPAHEIVYVQHMWMGGISSTATNPSLVKTEGQVIMKDLVTKYIAAILSLS